METFSAIFKILMGHGDVDSIKFSEEHRRESHKYYEKHDEFEKRIADNAELLKLFEEVTGAHDDEQATSQVDFYKAGFSLGLLLGIEAMQLNFPKE